MKTIVLIGSTGFIGRHLVRALSAEYKVVGISRSTADDAVTIPADIARGLPAAAPATVDVVIHCAAAYGEDPCVDGRDCFRTNVHGTYHVLTYASASGCKVFLYLSTGSVYGPSLKPLCEKCLISPKGAYAATKAAAELLVTAFSSHMRILCLRLFRPYGPGMAANRLIPTLIRKINQGLPVILRDGYGAPRTNPIYIDDLVEYIFRLLRNDRAVGVYNVGGIEVVSIAELAGIIARKLEKEVTYVVGEPLGGDFVADIRRVRSDTSYLPRWTVERGLEVMIKEQKA